MLLRQAAWKEPPSTLRFSCVGPLLLRLRVRDLRTALQAAGIRALLPAGFLCGTLSIPCLQKKGWLQPHSRLC